MGDLRDDIGAHFTGADEANTDRSPCLGARRQISFARPNGATLAALVLWAAMGF